MDASPYQALANRLDTLPNGFPPAEDGSHLRLLAKLFTPEEAALAAQLRMSPETAEQIAQRTGGDPAALRKQLKRMPRQRVDHRRPHAGPAGVQHYAVRGGHLRSPIRPHGCRDGAPVRRVLPPRLWQDAGDQTPGAPCHPHRREHPQSHGSAALRKRQLAGRFAQSWGVIDCICRTQKALIGEPCGHPWMSA